MCLSANQIGGPRRCAAHTRQAYKDALAAFRALEDESSYQRQVISNIKGFSHRLDSINPFFTAKKKEAFLISNLNEQMAGRPETVQALVTAYHEAITESVVQQQSLRAEQEELDREIPILEEEAYFRGDTNFRASKMYDELHARSYEARVGTIFSKKAAEIILKSKAEQWDDYTKIREDFDKAEHAYFSTDEGLFQGAALGYDEATKKKALALYSAASRSRGQVRWATMNGIRSKAKATKDWTENQKWENSIHSDPTLEAKATFELVEASNSFVALKAIDNYGRSCGWGLMVTQDANTGKVHKQIIRER
jgi:hypothetical protein